MLVNTEKHRRSIRFEGYDYHETGGYFVTICAARKRCVFGKIINGVVQLNAYGRIVAEEWQRTSALRKNVMLDEWVVMPNHFHGILVLIASGDESEISTPRVFARPQMHALPTIIGAFKSAVSRRVNKYRAERGFSKVMVWQRNYYERIIRDENELNAIRLYIGENPLNWSTDTENPNI